MPLHETLYIPLSACRRGVVQATAVAQADAEPLQDKLPHHFPVSWPDRCPTWRATPAPLPSTPPAAPHQGRGETPGPLEYQGCRPSLAEGGGPSANGVGVPFQGPPPWPRRSSLGPATRGSTTAPEAPATESSACARPAHPFPIVRETPLSPHTQHLPRFFSTCRPCESLDFTGTPM